MPRINQLPTASSVAQTDVLAIDTPEKTYQVPRSVLAPAPYIATIPTGQWSGSGSDRYITVTASNVTANAMLYPFYDNASAALLNGPVWVIPAAGSFTIHTSAIPSGTVTISVLLAGIVGEAQYQVLADVYSRSQVDSKIAQSTAWANHQLSNTSILTYAANSADPSFGTFRTNTTVTGGPTSGEYYIGYCIHYGQNISIHMTSMFDASKIYMNNSSNSGSSWTGWKTFLDSQSTASSLVSLVGTQLQMSKCGKLRTLYINSATFSAAALYTLDAADRPLRNVQVGIPGSSTNYLFVSSSAGSIGVLGSGGTYQAASGINMCVTYMVA